MEAQGRVREHASDVEDNPRSLWLPGVWAEVAGGPLGWRQ